MPLRPAVAALLVLSACHADRGAAGRPMTERERDSALGASAIPGARGIEGALRAQDSGAARQRLVDSLAADR